MHDPLTKWTANTIVFPSIVSEFSDCLAIRVVQFTLNVARRENMGGLGNLVKKNDRCSHCARLKVIIVAHLDFFAVVYHLSACFNMSWEKRTAYWNCGMWVCDRLMSWPDRTCQVVGSYISTWIMVQIFKCRRSFEYRRSMIFIVHKIVIFGHLWRFEVTLDWTLQHNMT